MSDRPSWWNDMFQKQGAGYTRRYPTTPQTQGFQASNPNTGRPSANYPQAANPYAGTPFEGEDGTLYQPTGKPDEWQEAGFKTPGAQVDTNNFLAGWDYQNPPTNAEGVPLDYNNNPLPEGATGFTPYGEPDFTPAGRTDLAATFEGWFKGIQYRLYKDVDLNEQGQSAMGEAWQNWLKQENKINWGDAGSIATAAEENLTDAWNVLMQTGPALRTLQSEEGDPNALTMGGRVVAEIGRGIGSAFNLFSKTAESLIGTGYMTGEQLAEGSSLPEIDLPDWVPGWAEVIAKGVGPLAAYNSLRMLTAPKKSWDEITDIVEENWQASRIAYSVINDDNLRDEFIRRYKAGDDPRYLAMELENPIEEMIGQLIFDPLNVAGYFTKTGAMARRLEGVEDIFIKPAGKVDEAFRALKANSLSEGVDSLRAMAEAVQTEMKAVGQNLDDLADNRGLLQLTTAGKRSDIANRSGQMLRFIFSNTRKANGAYDFDKAMDLIRGMINMADPNNLDNVAAAVNDVVKGAQVPRPLFSRAGMETAVLLRSLFETGADTQGELTALGRGLDFKGFLNGFEEAQKGGIETVLEWATKKLDNASQGYFPTVLEQAQAAERLAEYQRTGQITLKTGETLADVQRAGRLGKVSPITQMVARFDAVTKNKIYTPVNRFFANVYMGMSPGFAFRNLMNNALTIAVDAGPGSIFVGKEKAVNGIKNLLGGVTNSKLGGFGGGGLAAGIEGAVDAEKGLKWWQFGLQQSEKFEELGAAQVSYKAVKDAMRRMLRPGLALPDIEPLIQAGMEPQTANLLTRLVIEFDGNVGLATKRLRQLAGTGNIDLTKTLAWLADDDLRIAQGFNLEEEIRTILTGDASISEKKTALQQLATDKQTFAALSQHEMTGVTDMLQQGEGRSVAAVAQNAMQDKLISDAEGAIVNHRIWANAYAKRSYEALLDAVKMQGWEVLRQSNPELANQIPAILTPLQTKMTNLWNTVISEHDNFTRSVVAFSNEIKSGKGTSTFQNIWDALKIEGDMPANLTNDQFLDALWNHWRNTTRTRYATAREAYVALAESGWQEVARQTGYTPQKNLVEQAREYLRTARAYDDALVETTSKGPLVFQKKDMILAALNRGDNAQALRILADYYGLPTATAKGQPLDQVLLATLRKYGNETLDLNTPIDEAWRAFEAQRAAKNKGALIENLDDYLGRRVLSSDPVPQTVTEVAQDASVAKSVVDQPPGLINSATDAKVGQRVFINQAGDVWEAGTVERISGDGEVFVRLDSIPDLPPVKLPDAGENISVLSNGNASSWKVSEVLDNGKVVISYEQPPASVTQAKPTPLQTTQVSGRMSLVNSKNRILGYITGPERNLAKTSWTYRMFVEGVNQAEEFGFIPVDIAEKLRNENITVSGVKSLFDKLPDWTFEDIRKVNSEIRNATPGIEPLPAAAIEAVAPPSVPKVFTGDKIVSPQSGEVIGEVDEIVSEGKVVVRLESPPQSVETISAKQFIPADVTTNPSASSFVYTPPRVAQAAEGVAQTASVTESVPLPTPYMDGSMPTGPRATQENLKGLQTWLNNLSQRLESNAGKMTPLDFTPEIEQALSTWTQGATQGVGEARLMASAYADVMRDFALHDYSAKRNIDLVAAYLFPYEFWYTRTYKNWMTRLVTNPEVIAAYAKYHTALEKIHAGAPEWWKYNINTNELLGRNDDNPLFFNLEATLNPLNGLTGVDFSDPAKRVDWLTRTVDDIGKFGPSTWTPINFALALSLKAKGEDDAAARWAGRFIPQTAILRTIGNVFNMNIEVDPFVQFFSDGQDPYEKRRAATALATLAQGTYLDGQWVQITDEQAIDAANPTIRAQNPEAQQIWDMATSLALDGRTAGTLSSFFLGVGFKGRNQSELQVDRMYQDYYRLWNASANLSPDQFKQAMDSLHTQYPWMDAIIMAKKAGPEVDRALAYNALGRVPPGQASDLLPLFNLSEEMMQAFYAHKGDLSYMTAPDRARFMAGIAELSAALALPADASRVEWTEVRARYSAMQAQGQAQFGEDVWGRMSDFFALQKANPDAAKLMIANNPRLQAALDYREQAVMADPLLFDYYGGLDFLEKYWNGEMYTAAEKQFGATIFETSMQYGALADQESQLLQQYYDMKDAGDPNAKAFYQAYLDKDSNQKDLFLAAHPELKAYWDLKRDYQEAIVTKLAEFGDKIRDVRPELRPDYQPQGVYEIPAAAELGYQFPAPPTWGEYASLLTPAQNNLLLDYFNGGDLSRSMQTTLTRLAEQLGMDEQELLQNMEQAWYSEQVANP